MIVLFLQRRKQRLENVKCLAQSQTASNCCSHILQPGLSDSKVKTVSTVHATFGRDVVEVIGKKIFKPMFCL